MCSILPSYIASLTVLAIPLLAYTYYLGKPKFCSSEAPLLVSVVSMFYWVCPSLLYLTVKVLEKLKASSGPRPLTVFVVMLELRFILYWPWFSFLSKFMNCCCC